MLGEWKLPHVQETFLGKTTLKWIPAPANCTNKEINRIKSKKINRTLKLCTLATNNLIFRWPAIDSYLCISIMLRIQSRQNKLHLKIGKIIHALRY